MSASVIEAFRQIVLLISTLLACVSLPADTLDETLPTHYRNQEIELDWAQIKSQRKTYLNIYLVAVLPFGQKLSLPLVLDKKAQTLPVKFSLKDALKQLKQERFPYYEAVDF